MGRFRGAVWDPITGSGGPFTGGPLKVVWHKTQGATLAGARSAYRTNRSDPQYTVHKDGINQHIDDSLAGRSLRNASGGVQTNFDGAIQIEVVGFSGVTMDAATMDNCIRLAKYLETKGIPWVWPEGRPPMSSALGYGLYTGERHNNVWDTIGGHYGHSQVPENTHWDPAWTDIEWWVLNEKMGAVSAPDLRTRGIMYTPALALPNIAAEMTPPDGRGVWVLGTNGAVYSFGGAPYHGGMNGSPHFVGRVAKNFIRSDDGRYIIEATSGETYGPEF